MEQTLGKDVTIESFSKTVRIGHPNPSRSLVFETERQRNVAFIQKGITKPGRISYDVLRRASLSVHVARICINVLKEKVTKTKWIIKPIDPQQKNKNDDRIKELTELFRHPNGNDETMRTLLDKILEDLLVLDSVSLEKTRDGDGKLSGLHFVDSATIRPVFDEHGDQDVMIPLNTVEEGAMLMPVSYVQVLNNSQYGGPESGEIIAAWPRRDFINFHMHPQGSMEGIGYGLSPIEGVLSVVANILNADNYNGTYFEDGAFPPVILQILGQTNQRDIEQYRQYLQAELMGNFHRPAIMAGGTDAKVLKLKDQTNRDMEFMEYTKFLAGLLAAAYGLSSQDIGLTENVGSKNVSETQNDLSNQKGYGSILHLLKEIFNQDIIWKDFGYDDLEFDWVADDTTSAKDMTDILDKQLRAGIVTLNEARQESGKEPYGPWADKPMILTADGFKPVITEESDEEGQSKDKGADTTDDDKKEQKPDDKKDNEGSVDKTPAEESKEFDEESPDVDNGEPKRKAISNYRFSAFVKSLFNRPKEYTFDGLAMFGALVTDDAMKAKTVKMFDGLDSKRIIKDFTVLSYSYDFDESTNALNTYVSKNPNGYGGILIIDDDRGLRYDVYIKI